jgi:hypothetical protein
MPKTFRPWQPEQTTLLPPSPSDWLSDDHQVYFLLDLIDELEHLFFRIPELGDLQLRARDGLRPVVVITSNSEKDLPDAFLRRCVYHHLAFPDPERLREIVARQLQGWPCGTGAMADAIELFYRLREPRSGLRKKPATAELLGWLLTLPHVLGGQGGPISLGGCFTNPPDLASANWPGSLRSADDSPKPGLRGRRSADFGARCRDLGPQGPLRPLLWWP